MMIGAHLGQGRYPCQPVMHERAAVRRTGADSGSRELFVHDRPQNPPVSPNAPRKGRSSEVHELAGAGEVDGSRQGPGRGSPRPRPRVAKAQAPGRQGPSRGSPRHRPRVAKAQATGRAKAQATGRAKAQAQRLTVRWCGTASRTWWRIRVPWWIGCIPVHPIHPQARIHHANPRSPYSGASEGVNGAREAATSVRQPVLGVPRGRGQNPARKPPGSTQTTPGPGRVLRPHVSQFARPVDNLPDLLSLL
jgi:hypothetical protein